MSAPFHGRAISLFLLAGVFALTGCGPPAAKVSGRVTCQGKAITGMIQFSPKGEGPNNTGLSMTAQLADDGTYNVLLRSIGPHTVIVTPSDIKIVAEEGGIDHACDRRPFVEELVAGENTVNVDLKTRTR